MCACKQSDIIGNIPTVSIIHTVHTVHTVVRYSQILCMCSYIPTNSKVKKSYAREMPILSTHVSDMLQKNIVAKKRTEKRSKRNNVLFTMQHHKHIQSHAQIDTVSLSKLVSPQELHMLLLILVLCTYVTINTCILLLSVPCHGTRMLLYYY